MPVDETQELQQPQELQQLIMMSGQASDDQVEDVLLRLSEAGSYGRVAPGTDSIVVSAFGDPQMIHSLGAGERARRGARAAGEQAVQARLGRVGARAAP